MNVGSRCPAIEFDMQLQQDIAEKKNPADVLSEHWDLPSVWNVMKPLLFWIGS